MEKKADILGIYLFLYGFVFLLLLIMLVLISTLYDGVIVMRAKIVRTVFKELLCRNNETIEVEKVVRRSFLVIFRTIKKNLRKNVVKRNYRMIRK